jgi:hypothetical protein
VNCAEGSMAFGGGATCTGSSLASSQPLLGGTDNMAPIGWKATCSNAGSACSTYAVCCCAK